MTKSIKQLQLDDLLRLARDVGIPVWDKRVLKFEELAEKFIEQELDRYLKWRFGQSS